MSFALTYSVVRFLLHALLTRPFVVDTVWLTRLYVLFFHRGGQPSRPSGRLHLPADRSVGWCSKL